MSMRAIKIEPDGSVQRVEITGNTIEAQNDSIHGYLGGYFDIVRTARLGSDTVMLVDDEGLLKELPVNPTAMLVSGYPGWLVGTALILGTAPSPDGDVFTDVPERFRLRGEEASA